MRIKFQGSYGFAGTDFTDYEDIPEKVVTAGEEAIKNYVEQAANSYFYDYMIERLSLSHEIEEDE